LKVSLLGGKKIMAMFLLGRARKEANYGDSSSKTLKVPVSWTQRFFLENLFIQFYLVISRIIFKEKRERKISI